MTLFEVLATISEVQKDIDIQLNQVKDFKSRNSNNISRIQEELKGTLSNHDINMIKDLTEAGKILEKAESALQQAADNVSKVSRV